MNEYICGECDDPILDDEPCCDHNDEPCHLSCANEAAADDDFDFDFDN